MINSQEKGFTFLEMLLVMAIVLLMTSLLPLLLNVRLFKYENVNGFHHIEWEIFVQQLKKELNESKQWKTSGTTLYLEKFTGEQVSFELYQSSIRRQVNGTGNETALQFVENVTYILTNRGIFLRVTSSEGKTYEAFISRLFSQGGGGDAKSKRRDFSNHSHDVIFLSVGAIPCARIVSGGNGSNGVRTTIS